MSAQNILYDGDLLEHDSSVRSYVQKNIVYERTSERLEQVKLLAHTPNWLREAALSGDEHARLIS